MIVILRKWVKIGKRRFAKNRQYARTRKEAIKGPQPDKVGKKPRVSRRQDQRGRLLCVSQFPR